jgi:hypothetical protein
MQASKYMMSMTSMRASGGSSLVSSLTSSRWLSPVGPGLLTCDLLSGAQSYVAMLTGLRRPLLFAKSCSLA